MDNNIHEMEEYSDKFSEEDPLKEEIETKKLENKTWGESLIDVFKSTTVEPCLLVYVSAFIINDLATQNLALEKACRVSLNYSDEICQSLMLQTTDGQSDYEREVQKIMASAVAVKAYIVYSLPCVIGLVVGSWSDKTGHRKIFVIIPLFGQFLKSIINMFNTYFMKELSIEFLLYGEGIMESLTGGWCVGCMTIFSYIAAVTTNENRTFRMGIVNFCQTAGIPIGMMFGGFILNKLGYYGSYGITGCVLLLNLIYTIFILKDSPRTKEQRQHDNKGFWYKFRQFFDLTNIKDSLKFLFTSGPKKRRLSLIVMCLVNFVLFGPFYGEISVWYINMRYRFNWDEVKFSVFQTVNFVLHTIGTLTAIWLLSKTWNWHDTTLGMISTMSKILAFFMYCFAPNEKIFYIGPLLEMFNGVSLLAIKSIVSKLVKPDELGKVNSVISLVENSSPLLYVPIYAKVYIATMEVLPGAVFLVSSGLTIPGFVVFTLNWCKYKKAKRRLKKENKTPAKFATDSC